MADEQQKKKKPTKDASAPENRGPAHGGEDAGDGGEADLSGQPREGGSRTPLKRGKGKGQEGKG